MNIHCGASYSYGVQSTLNCSWHSERIKFWLLVRFKHPTCSHVIWLERRRSWPSVQHCNPVCSARNGETSAVRRCKHTPWFTGKCGKRGGHTPAFTRVLVWIQKHNSYSFLNICDANRLSSACQGVLSTSTHSPAMAAHVCQTSSWCEPPPPPASHQQFGIRRQRFQNRTPVLYGVVLLQKPCMAVANPIRSISTLFCVALYNHCDFNSDLDPTCDICTGISAQSVRCHRVHTPCSRVVCTCSPVHLRN
jgi:hypothetical protein